MVVVLRPTVLSQAPSGVYVRFEVFMVVAMKNAVFWGYAVCLL
jgi:hypothetical protein